MTRSLESDYLDPHHVGKDDADFTTGFERTSLESARVERLAKPRDGKRQENGLQAHLREVHGYALTRLAALTVVQLVFRHRDEHRGQFIHEVHRSH